MYSDEEEDTDGEDDSEDDDVRHKGKTSDDDDYIDDDEAASDVDDDDEESFIMEITGPTPQTKALEKTVVQTAALMPAAIPVPAPSPAPAPATAPAPPSALSPAPLPVPPPALSPAPLPVPPPAHPPAPSVTAGSPNDIRRLIGAYGEAVLRCSLDHTPATAVKLEDDIAKACQAVVEFHRAAILKVEQAPSKIDVELVNRLQKVIAERLNLKQDIVTMSKEITQKHKEAKRREVDMMAVKSLHNDALLREKELREQLLKIRQETDAKRKRVEESISKASKKASL